MAFQINSQARISAEDNYRLCLWHKAVLKMNVTSVRKGLDIYLLLLSNKLVRKIGNLYDHYQTKSKVSMENDDKIFILDTGIDSNRLYTQPKEKNVLHRMPCFY